MSWVLAYLLFLVTAVLLFQATYRKGATWASRVRDWVLSLLPIAILFGDYPIVYLQHLRDCKADAGLKIYIQPTKSDSFRVNYQDTSCTEPEAKGVLYEFYPKLKMVEATECGKDTAHTNFYSFSVTSTKTPNFLTIGVLKKHQSQNPRMISI